MARLEEEIGLLQADTASKAEIFGEGESLVKEWPKMDKKRKRELVENLGEQITVHKNRKVEFALNYVPGQSIVNSERNPRGLCGRLKRRSHQGLEYKIVEPEFGVTEEREVNWRERLGGLLRDYYGMPHETDTFSIRTVGDRRLCVPLRLKQVVHLLTCSHQSTTALG